MKKGKLRKQRDASLLETVERVKADWLRQKQNVEKSIEPSEAAVHEMKMAEARYSFLLREIRVLFSDKPS